MFFSEKEASKKRGRQKKRDRNIYGIFGNSDSDDSEVDNERCFGRKARDYGDYRSDSDESYSNEEENDGNFKKSKVKNKNNKKNNEYKEDFSGFVSGGTLKGSEVDGSSTGERKDKKGEREVNKRNLKREMNSDEELLNKILDYDDFVLVKEDEELLTEKRNQLKFENRLRDQYRSKKGKRVTEEDYVKENEVMKEDKMKQIYGKGLNMLKKMGYKGGALGKEGKGLLKPLSFSTSKINKDVYKIEQMDQKEQVFGSKLWEKEGSTEKGEEDEFLEKLENKCKELYNKKENVRKKIKELNEENAKITDEIKVTKNEIAKRVVLLDKIKTMIPKVTANYKEYVKTLNDMEEVRNENDVGEIVEKLIKLLKQLSKVEYSSKLSKGVVKFTFQKLFQSETKGEFHNKLSNYDKLFESLKKISSYMSNKSGDGAKNRELKEIVNYYLINELMDYYQKEWDPLNVEEGFNKYNYLHKRLNVFYNTEEEEYEKESFEEDGLRALLTEIMNKLTEHIEGLKAKELYNCHIVFFPWLEFLTTDQIDLVVNLFLETLFKNTENFISTTNIYNNKNKNTNNSGYKDDSELIGETAVERYEHVYSNWNKLMPDKSEFGRRISHKLLEELSSINSSLIFNLEDPKSESLKKLVNQALNWSGLIGEERTVQLLLGSILELFVQFLGQSIKSMYESVRIDCNSNADEQVGTDGLDNKGLRKDLKEKREKIVEYYLHFKSLFPDYVNRSKQVQEHCYRKVLNKMESFTKSYISLLNSCNSQNTKEGDE